MSLTQDYFMGLCWKIIGFFWWDIGYFQQEGKWYNTSERDWPESYIGFLF